jgi:hypothetical protein
VIKTATAADRNNPDSIILSARCLLKFFSNPALTFISDILEFLLGENMSVIITCFLNLGQKKGN